MQKTQTWVALTLVAVIGVLAGGWFLLVAPQRAQAADLAGQAASQRSAVAAVRLRLATLQAQADGLPAQRARLAAVQAKLPAVTAVPELVRALSAAAGSSGVELVSVTPDALGPPSAGTPAAGAAAATPAPSTAIAAPASGVQVLPVTIQVVGSYPEIERYLALLEELPRAFRVTALSVAPGVSPVAMAASTSTGTAAAAVPAAKDGSSLAVGITGEVYVLPGATSSATTATPMPTAVAPDSTTAH